MRYIILVLINLPIIGLAVLNFLTKYKMRKITKQRFLKQLLAWSVLLVILVASFPVYNILNGKPPLESDSLSFFDIVQTTAIIVLFYIINDQRQKIDQSDRRLRDLHQELSIKLSKND